MQQFLFFCSFCVRCAGIVVVAGMLLTFDVLIHSNYMRQPDGQQKRTKYISNSNNLKKTCNLLQQQQQQQHEQYSKWGLANDERRLAHGAYEQWPGINARPHGVYAIGIWGATNGDIHIWKTWLKNENGQQIVRWFPAVF